MRGFEGAGQARAGSRYVEDSRSVDERGEQFSFFLLLVVPVLRTIK